MKTLRCRVITGIASIIFMFIVSPTIDAEKAGASNSKTLISALAALVNPKNKVAKVDRPVNQSPINERSSKSNLNHSSNSNKKKSSAERAEPQRFVTAAGPAAGPENGPPPEEVVLPERVGKGNRVSSSLSSRIHINGFISAGSSKALTSNNAKYLVPDHGSIGDKLNFGANSLAGIQITADIISKLSAVVQIVADGDDTNGNDPYHVTAEWAYLRFEVSHNFQTRSGRFRLPAFLYSDTVQVRYSYPWVILPNEVYRIVPFNNINGVDIIYSFGISDTGWVIRFQPYYGTNSSEFDLYTSNPLIAQGTTADFDENDIMGAVVSISNPYFTLRGTYARLRLSAELRNFVVPPGFPDPALVGRTIKLPLFSNESVRVYSIGAKVNYHNVIANAEFAHRSTPDQIASLTGYYMMLGYHISKFLPHLTFARIKTTNTAALMAAGGELPQEQESITLGLAYYISSHLVSKISVSHITPLKGTNGLFDANPGRRNVMMYSASLDAIF